MPTNQNTETHLSKDELMEILNEIDTERQYHRKITSEHRTENVKHQKYHNPNNQFY